MIKIAPSLLSANFADLTNEIKKVEQAGADLLHIDIMDGHFVPNLTFGPPVVAAIKKVSALPFDVHLMVKNPETLIDDFARAGADIITIHAETAPHLHRLLQNVKELGLRAGIALNPSTPLSAVEEVLDMADMILIMSVNPGFGGQKFISSATSKIARLKQLIDDRQLKVDIEVDGGINPQTAKEVIKAGANVLVAGSAIYGASDIPAAIKNIRGC